jgi:hypothetical protein
LGGGQVPPFRLFAQINLTQAPAREFLMEPGSGDDHTTMWRWVQRYGPALEQGLRRYLKPTNKSWRVDETYVRVALAPLQFSGIVRTELLTPEPNRFIRDDDSAFGEKILDIPEA